MKAVTLPAIFSGIKSRKDKTYNLSFDTRELGTDAVQLFNMAHSECWVLIAQSQDQLAQAAVPDFKPETGAERKTPSQRLRAVLYIYFSQLGGENRLGMSFDAYYSSKLESIIDSYKAKLDDGERQPN